MTKTRTRNKWIAIVFFGMVSMTMAGASADIADIDDPPEKGYAIAAESDARDSGFGDFAADVDMVLNNRNGTESQRELHIRVLEGTGGQGPGDRSLIVIVRPRDIEGTALLTISHADSNDDQWVYLPALRRVKRVSSTNRSGPFVGSEFSYEDLVWADIDRYSYLWVQDDELDGIPVHIVERRPTYSNSGYVRQLVWYDQAELRVLRIQYYDRKNELLKELVVSGYQRYEDTFWRADELFMTNYQNGKTTRLRWRNYSFGNGLSDQDFNMNRLGNLR